MEAGDAASLRERTDKHLTQKFKTARYCHFECDEGAYREAFQKK